MFKILTVRLSSLAKRPKATGFQIDLYSLSDTVPESKRAAIETEFFNPLDSKGSETIRKLREHSILDVSERLLWAKFIAFMRIRTPENIAIVKETGKRAFIEEFSKGQERWDELREDGDPPTVLEWVEQRYPGIRENIGLGNLPNVATRTIGKINSMAWHTLDFKGGKHSLLSSDNPCVFAGGIDDENCIIALPLSPRHAFVAFYDGSHAQASLKRRGPTAVGAALNQSVVGQARERAYCYSKTDAPEIFYRTHLRPVPNRSRS